MPIYEYECKNCGHHLEAIQGFNDAPLTDCPDCKKADLVKLLSAPAFHLKGSGWYVTDFKNPTAGKKENETKATATPAAESKTEAAKPETTKE